MKSSAKAQAALCHPDYASAAKLTPMLKLATPAEVVKSRKMLNFFGWLSIANSHVSVKNTNVADVPVRVYKPKQAGALNGVVLWLHGGGCVLGRPENDDRQTAAAALELNCEIWSVDYRLAPEHPFPAAHNDILSVWQVMQRRSERTAWVGISGGGGLAAGALQRLAETQQKLPNAVALIYPMLDDRSAEQSKVADDYHCVWNGKQNRAAWQYYLASVSSAEPFAVPARTQMTQPWPPTWLGVGELDLFHEEVLSFHSALQSLGSKTELRSVPAMPHSFDLLNSRAAPTREFTNAYQQFIKQNLAL